MGRAANGDGPCRREKPGLPPMVSLREHRGTNISIQLISCQEKNGAHIGKTRSEAPPFVEQSEGHPSKDRSGVGSSVNGRRLVSN